MAGKDGGRMAGKDSGRLAYTSVRAEKARCEQRRQGRIRPEDATSKRLRLVRLTASNTIERGRSRTCERALVNMCAFLQCVRSAQLDV
eukprot:1182209-Pleurochrysis_carterae.AAC.6